MSDGETLIFKTLIDLHQLTRSAISTVIVADTTSYCVRQARTHLARLEAKGYVERRKSRGGWLPVRSVGAA